MGRKPLKVIKTTVRLSPEIGERIDAVAGKYGRAAFIRQAIVRALEFAEWGKEPPPIEDESDGD